MRNQMYTKEYEVQMFIGFSVMVHELYGWLQNYIYLDEKKNCQIQVFKLHDGLYHKKHEKLSRELFPNVIEHKHLITVYHFFIQSAMYVTCLSLLYDQYPVDCCWEHFQIRTKAVLCAVKRSRYVSQVSCQWQIWVEST